MMLSRSLILFVSLISFADAFVVRSSSRPQMMTLNAKSDVESVRKKEFVAIMAEELGYTKTDAEAALNCVIDTIAENLADGKKTVFPGFGTFEPRSRSARVGRNPKTGEKIEIKASVGAGFSAAKGLKDRLNGRD